MTELLLFTLMVVHSYGAGKQTTKIASGWENFQPYVAICMARQLCSQICTDNIVAQEFACTHENMADSEEELGGTIYLVILNNRKK